jgi:hypothetical protein
MNIKQIKLVFLKKLAESAKLLNWAIKYDLF